MVAVFARRSLIRLAVLVSCIGLLLVASLVLLRSTDPDFMHDEEMQLPRIMSGVWVSGFEESSFFPGNDSIPDRNDPRRYRLTLVADKEQQFKLRDQNPQPGYLAHRVTFLGRRTKYPVAIDCQGDRHYFYIPDLFLQTQYLGAIADPDMPVRGPPRPYQPFKRSAEGGRIRELEDRALAGCSR